MSPRIKPTLVSLPQCVVGWEQPKRYMSLGQSKDGFSSRADGLMSNHTPYSRGSQGIFSWPLHSARRMRTPRLAKTNKDSSLGQERGLPGDLATQIPLRIPLSRRKEW